MVQLLKLMEFAPLYYYSPIHDPLDDIYPNTLDGWQAMKDLALEACDRRFLLLLELYRLAPIPYISKILRQALNRPARIPLYELLFHKIEKAACDYPDRDYGEERNRRIENARKKLSEKLLLEGYHGQYPLFQKGTQQILAMEEHPFTILESKTFQFRIQLMTSETKHSDNRLNAGFFDKKGNKYQISTFKDA